MSKSHQQKAAEKPVEPGQPIPATPTSPPPATPASEPGGSPSVEAAIGQALAPQAVHAPPATMSSSDMLAEYAGAGFEDVKAADLAFPFWKLVQSTTAEAKTGDPAYVAGVEAGMWYDTITKEAYHEIIFVPCKFVTHYIEWELKTLGALVENHGLDDRLFQQSKRDDETGALVTPKGTRIVPTGTWFGVVIGAMRRGPKVLNERRQEIKLDDEIFAAGSMLRRAVLTFQGTAAKVSKRWISTAQALEMTTSSGQRRRPPIFAMSYLLQSVPTKNDQGSWFLPTVSKAGWILDYANGTEIMQECIEFGKLATGAKLNPAEESAPKGPLLPSDEMRAAERNAADTRRDLDDDIPF